MAKKQTPATEGFNEILLYTTPNGKVKVEIYLQNETIWLTQQKIADLFGVERSVVTKHLKNIFDQGELIKEATCAKIAQVQNEGGRIKILGNHANNYFPKEWLIRMALPEIPIPWYL